MGSCGEGYDVVRPEILNDPQRKRSLVIYVPDHLRDVFHEISIDLVKYERKYLVNYFFISSMFLIIISISGTYLKMSFTIFEYIHIVVANIKNFSLFVVNSFIFEYHISRV